MFRQSNYSLIDSYWSVWGNRAYFLRAHTSLGSLCSSWRDFWGWRGLLEGWTDTLRWFKAGCWWWWWLWWWSWWGGAGAGAGGRCVLINMLLLQYSGLILTLLMGTFILLSHWLVTHSQSICFFKFDSSQGVRLVCNCWHGEGPGWGAKLQVNLGIDQQKISYSDLLLIAILSVRNKLCPMTMTLSPKSL